MGLIDRVKRLEAASRRRRRPIDMRPYIADGPPPPREARPISPERLAQLKAAPRTGRWAAWFASMAEWANPGPRADDEDEYEWVDEFGNVVDGPGPDDLADDDLADDLAHNEVGPAAEGDHAT